MLYNIDVARSRYSNSVKTSKSTYKVGNLKIHKKSTVIIMVSVACFILGILIGVFILHALTKDDCFEVNGQADIELVSGDVYEELGVKCISFNQDVTETVRIQYFYREDMSYDTCEVDKIDTTIDGIYYVVYTSSNFKYRAVQLIRNVIVLRTED